MQFLDYFKIGGNWIVAGIVWAIVAILVFQAIKHSARIAAFIREVKAELRKANWPWESDPKIKGFKKYKELVDSTVVVLIATILLAGFVSMWDFIHTNVVTFIVTKLGA